MALLHQEASHLCGIRLHSRMLHESILPDNYLMASILKARGSQSALREGKEIHRRAMKLGSRSNVLWSWGWWSYTENEGNQGMHVGCLMKCLKTLSRSPWWSALIVIRDWLRKLVLFLVGSDMVFWTAIIDGYMGHGEMNRVLEEFSGIYIYLKDTKQLKNYIIIRSGHHHHGIRSSLSPDQSNLQILLVYTLRHLTKCSLQKINKSWKVLENKVRH